MIDPNELVSGNYVYVHSGFYPVGINEDYLIMSQVENITQQGINVSETGNKTITIIPFDKLETIPLSVKILENFGFVQFDHNTYHKGIVIIEHPDEYNFIFGITGKNKEVNVTS